MNEKNLVVSTLLDYYGALLTDKQRDLAELYYTEDLSLGEIAELQDISRQGVRASIKRGEAFLFELEDKLRMAEKMRRLSEGLDEISRTVDHVFSIGGGDVREYFTKIKRIADALQQEV